MFRLDGAAKLNQRLGKSSAFSIGFGAGQRGGGMLVLRELGTLPRTFDFLPNACELIFADGEFQPEAGQFTLHLAVTVHCGDDFAIRLTLLFIDFGECLFRRTQFRADEF